MITISPAQRVVLVVALLFTALAALCVIAGRPGAIVLIPVAVLAGPFMGMTFPFDPLFKIGYVASLLASLALAIFGVVKISSSWGQLAAVLGVVLWSVCGAIGLGTGT